MTWASICPPTSAYTATAPPIRTSRPSSASAGLPTPYPSNFFDPILSCDAPAREKATPFCDPRLERMVRDAKRAQDTSAGALWHAADVEAVDQAAWVALTNQLGVDVIGRRVGNYQHNPQFGILLGQLWVK